MHTGKIYGASKVIKEGVLGVVEVSSVNQGPPSSSVKIPAPASQVSHFSFQGAIPRGL